LLVAWSSVIEDFVLLPYLGNMICTDGSGNRLGAAKLLVLWFSVSAVLIMKHLPIFLMFVAGSEVYTPTEFYLNP